MQKLLPAHQRKWWGLSPSLESGDYPPAPPPSAPTPMTTINDAVSTLTDYNTTMSPEALKEWHLPPSTTNNRTIGLETPHYTFTKSMRVLRVHQFFQLPQEVSPCSQPKAYSFTVYERVDF